MNTTYDKIIVIVQRELAQVVLQTARASGAVGGAIFRAHGTVSNEMLDLLGLEDTQRSVIHMVSRRRNTLHVMSVLSERYQMSRAGHGIVFTTPITSTKGINALFHLRDKHLLNHGLPNGEVLDDSHHQTMEESIMNAQYEMLNIIVKSGYAEDAMVAAKAAGAQGGTIMHARGVGIHESVTLFGVAIEPEKDVLMIVVKKEISEQVMTAIAEKAGLNMPGQGLLFATPVTRIMGIVHEQTK